MKEEWKSIDRWPYEVSDTGRVRRLPGTSKTGAGILSPGIGHAGHRFVYLCKNGLYKYRAVHRLVADVFIRHLGSSEVVHHIDNDPSNNIVSNLKILSSRGINSALAASSNITWYKICAKDVAEIKKLLNLKKHTQDEIASKFNVTRITIHRIKSEKRWTHVEAAL